MYPRPLGVVVQDLGDGGVSKALGGCSPPPPLHTHNTAKHLRFPAINRRIGNVPRPVYGVCFVYFRQTHHLKQIVTIFQRLSDIKTDAHAPVLAPR